MAILLSPFTDLADFRRKKFFSGSCWVTHQPKGAGTGGLPFRKGTVSSVCLGDMSWPMLSRTVSTRTQQPEGIKMSDTEYDLQTVCANCGNRFGDHRTADNGCPLARTWRNHHPGFSNSRRFTPKVEWVAVETQLLRRSFEATDIAGVNDRLTGIPMNLLDGLIELFSEDLGCDHSVGICMCGIIGLVAELKLAKMGKTYCSDCHGDGQIWSQETHDEALKRDPRYAEYDSDGLGYAECDNHHDPLTDEKPFVLHSCDRAYAVSPGIFGPGVVLKMFWMLWSGVETLSDRESRRAGSPTRASLRFAVATGKMESLKGFWLKNLESLRLLSVAWCLAKPGGTCCNCSTPMLESRRGA